MDRYIARGALGIVLAFVAAVPMAAQAQIYVYPRRPNKTQVRYYDFDWRYIDLLVGPEADTSDAEKAAPRVAPPEQGGDVPRTFPSRSTAWETGAPAALHDLIRGRASGNLFLRDAPVSLSREPGAADRYLRRGPGGAWAQEGGLAPPPPTEPPPATTVPPPEAPAAQLEPRGEEVKTDLHSDLGDRSGGVRLYFYDRAHHIAERAAGFITDSYRYLVEQFDYVPTRTFPYILYSTYQEFLQTNLFPLQEGVLGVTSPTDLKLTLPYFGDHRLFEEVGTHEMVHQFTIQKLRTVAEEGGLWGDPIQAFPLWFIEGIAEYYAQRGLDPEAEMLVRDIVVNPDFFQGYAMLDFFEDRPFSVLWTYKAGQVRVGFLEETYGEGTIQRILEQSALLVGSVGVDPRVGGFPGLIEKITGDEPRVVSAKFERWIKQRSFRTFIESGQSAPAVQPLEKWKGIVNALAASPSGNLLLYRSIDPTTGQIRLYLADRRSPGETTRVAADGVPGVESLHPVAGRNFDLTDTTLVFTAESKGRDVLYWQPIRHEAEEIKVETVEGGAVPSPSRGAEWGGPTGVTEYPGGGPPSRASLRKEMVWEVDVSLGPRTRYGFTEHQIIGIDSPTLSPEGDRVAFIGLRIDGLKDLYVLEPTGDGQRVVQLTDDEWAERQASWGPQGIVFTSDATGHGKYNLFLADPDRPGRIRRLTTEARDHQDPEVLPTGEVYFVAYEGGRADLYQLADDRIVRRTDIATGLFAPSPGPDGGLWALWHQAGQRRPVLVPAEDLLSVASDQVENGSEPRELPRLGIDGAVGYEPFTLKNWELGNLFGFFGAGASGVYGQLLASATDRLRNHGLLLNVYVVGSFDLTDGYLLYVNQEDRTAWGTGLFQSLTVRMDQTFPDIPFRFQSWERFYGALGTVRYPFNTYQYVQADVALGGVNYFLSEGMRAVLATPAINLTGRNLLIPWEAANGSTRMQGDLTLRLGHDTIRYHPGTGPFAGSSFLAEWSTTLQPFEGEAFHRLRLDAEHYFPIFGRTNFFVRGGAGTSFGGRLARQYYLSSFDTIRGVPFGDRDFLLGKHFMFATAELQFPLNALIRFILFQDIEGIVGADFGMVGNDFDSLLDKRVLDLVLGVNFALGPLVFRLHFAKPFDIGANPIEAGVPQELPNNGDWVTNFSLGWLYF